MSSVEDTGVKRVLVVGGGPSGITALKQFSTSHTFQLVCMEQLPVVGGLWNYSDVIKQANHPTGSQYTAIYKNLKTNIPKQLMLFSDLPFRHDLPSYAGHTDVLEYLCKYAETHKLHQYIKFNTRVTSVRPKVMIGQEDSWQVESINVLSKKTEISDFDIVIVCSGIYFKASIPVVKGMEGFKGKIMHSQEFKDPEHFRGKRVMLVGSGPSGIDISIDINKTAEKVWLSNKNPKKQSLPDSIKQVREFIEFTTNGVVVKECKDQEGDAKIYTTECNTMKSSESTNQNFELKNENNKVNSKNEAFENVPEIKESDDDKLVTIDQVDVVVFCTGYEYSLPFLNADCGVSTNGKQGVGPLYKDTICLGRQSLSFIGLNSYGCMLQFEFQAKFLLAFYEEKFKIPCYGKTLLEMVEKDIENKKSKDINVYEKPFQIPFYQWVVMDEMAEMAGFDKVHGKYEKLFRDVDVERGLSQENYKNIDYELGADGFFVKTPIKIVEQN